MVVIVERSRQFNCRHAGGATLYRCAEVLEVLLDYFIQDLPKTGNGTSDNHGEAMAFLLPKTRPAVDAGHEPAARTSAPRYDDPHNLGRRHHQYC